MKPNRITAAVMTTVLLALSSCATSPRTTTPDERAVAMAVLTTVETGVAALLATGKITQEQYTLASQQAAQLRIEVADSAESPITWLDLYQRIMNLALAWLPKPRAR